MPAPPPLPSRGWFASTPGSGRMIVHLFTQLPFGDAAVLGYRSSAVLGALACGALCCCARLLRASPVPAQTAAWLHGVSEQSGRRPSSPRSTPSTRCSSSPPIPSCCWARATVLAVLGLGALARGGLAGAAGPRPRPVAGGAALGPGLVAGAAAAGSGALALLGDSVVPIVCWGSNFEPFRLAVFRPYPLVCYGGRPVGGGGHAVGDGPIAGVDGGRWACNGWETACSTGRRSGRRGSSRPSSPLGAGARQESWGFSVGGIERALIDRFLG